MKIELPEKLVEAITEDVNNRDSFANKETIASCLNNEIYDYLDFQKDLTTPRKSKIVLTHNHDGNTFSIKGYNVIINMKELWRQLPDTLESLVVIFASDEFANVFASILSIIKDAVNLFGIELSKKEEAVLVVIAYLSRHGKTANMANIFKLYKNLRKNNASFPIIIKNERQHILESLIYLKCIAQDSEGNYKSKEKILL